MLGYLGEPVMRLDATGLSVNAASPTALAMHLVAKEARGQRIDAPLAPAARTSHGPLARLCGCRGCRPGWDAGAPECALGH